MRSACRSADPAPHLTTAEEQPSDVAAGKRRQILVPGGLECLHHGPDNRSPRSDRGEGPHSLPLRRAVGWRAHDRLSAGEARAASSIARTGDRQVPMINRRPFLGTLTAGLTAAPLPAPPHPPRTGYPYRARTS